MKNCHTPSSMSNKTSFIRECNCAVIVQRKTYYPFKCNLSIRLIKMKK
ncbi:unnamed protein product [Schistosoma mattheei]|uniref:Uncharacterized protein n=1 Tax=Schistosoma mattheei TaxID=31246 RepID=A0A183PBD5_9TREM|nr:unnamed protein product [Schistosoma mattheei]